MRGKSDDGENGNGENVAEDESCFFVHSIQLNTKDTKVTKVLEKSFMHFVSFVFDNLFFLAQRGEQ
jgi:hypothetical protein